MKLKRFIELFILFFFFGIVTCQSQASIPKVEKIYKNVPELIIKDSLFLCGIDSLIFKSICPEIKEKELKFFIIDSYEKKDSIYLSFCLASYFEYSGHNHQKGYFKYKDYTSMMKKMSKSMWKNAMTAVQVAHKYNVQTLWYAKLMQALSVRQQYNNGYWLQFYIYKDLEHTFMQKGDQEKLKQLTVAYYSGNWKSMLK